MDKIKIATETNPYATVFLVPDSRGESETYEAVSLVCETPEGRVVWAEGVRKDRAFMSSDFRSAIDAVLLPPTYWTVLVPWSENRTEWHPLAQDRSGPWSVLTRGAFGTESSAHAWAKEHLQGQSYTVKFVSNEVAP